MTSDYGNYEKLKGFAQAKKAASGSYDGKMRHLWPFVVGKSKKPASQGAGDEQIVLGYQFYVASPDPGNPVEGWRCYKLAKFGDDVSELADPSIERPSDLNADELKRQNAVMVREVPPP